MLKATRLHGALALAYLTMLAVHGNSKYMRPSMARVWAIRAPLISVVWVSLGQRRPPLVQPLRVLWLLGCCARRATPQRT